MKELHRVRTWRGFYRGAAVCAACLLFWLAGITGLAARTGTVQTENVNVRKDAGADSDRVCQLPAGTAVAVLDETQGGDGNTWYNVSFTYEGAETTGWIRSDMLSVSESEEPEGEEGGSEGGASIGGYSIREPEEAYSVSDALVSSSIQIGEQSFTAWQVNGEYTGGAELYLVYASREDGSTGWFYYDPQEGTFQRDLGQFSGGSSGGQEPEGLVQALEAELSELKESSEKALSQRLYFIIGLGVLSAILLILVIVFAVKYRNTEYEYYDEDEEEDEYPEKRKLFSRRSRDAEEEEAAEEPANDFDEFVAAVRKKWSQDEDGEYDEDEDYDDDAYDGDGYEDDEYDDDGYEDDEYDDGYDDDEYDDDGEYDDEYPEEDYEEEEPDGDDYEDDIELPEIDMSAVLEIEEEARSQAERDEAGDDDDGFDIEILDFEDLDL